jgi:hypothetical protein
MTIDLIRDVLDDQVLDREELKMGKVDGLVLDWQPGKQPRVTAIEMGPQVWARRARWKWVQGFAAWLSRHGPHAPGAFRFRWSEIVDTGLNVKLDVNAARTPAVAWENWLRDHVVKRIPGA